MKLSALIALWAAAVWAQGKPLCSLLTARDLAALGVTGSGAEAEQPSARGEPVKVCNWRMTDGGIHLSVTRVPPNVSREEFKAMLNRNFAALKAKGWTEEAKTFGGISCAALAPPAKDDAPMTTGCLTEIKGLVVSVGTRSKAKVPIETVKTLLETAAERL